MAPIVFEAVESFVSDTGDNQGSCTGPYPDNYESVTGQDGNNSSGEIQRSHKYVPMHRNVYDLSIYYEYKQKASKKLRFGQVQLWDDFEKFVRSKMEGINIENANPEMYYNGDCSESLGIDRFFSRLDEQLTTIMQANDIDAEISVRPDQPFLGTCHNVFRIFDKEGPGMIGVHRAGSEISAVSNNAFFLKVLGSADKIATDLSRGETETHETMCYLCSLLLLNACDFGYISSGSCTRFVQMTRITKIESYNEITICVRISPPIAHDKQGPYTLLTALLAIGLQSIEKKEKESRRRENFEFKLSIQTLPEPDTLTFNRFEAPCKGRKKWWKYKKDNELVAYVKFHENQYASPLSVNSSKDDGNINYGILSLGLNPDYLEHEMERSETEFSFLVDKPNIPNFDIRRTVLKCCDYNNWQNGNKLSKLENEGQIYAYLESRALHTVPRRYIYGDILGMMKVLALEPVGRSLRCSDVNKSVGEQIRACVNSLHEHKILHHDIRLSNFTVDELGKVRIINFGSAKLYMRLLAVVVEEEMRQVDDMISECINET